MEALDLPKDQELFYGNLAIMILPPEKTWPNAQDKVIIAAQEGAMRSNPLNTFFSPFHLLGWGGQLQTLATCRKEMA